MWVLEYAARDQKFSSSPRSVPSTYHKTFDQITTISLEKHDSLTHLNRGDSTQISPLTHVHEKDPFSVLVINN